mgnify:CR=1 FL=1|tara:strand:- start:349 stop:786 length:438 start_codon:yes stop_codon:yes gene_type:complete
MSKVIFETDEGNITFDLFSDDAPNTVNNFMKLVKEGFYDGLKFHRVIPGFMAQGGCPNTREGSSGMPGTGGPGYSIKCEINSKKHLIGSLSMAHAGKDTGGSQFFIVYEAQPHLDGVHTVFGKTTDMDIVLNLKNGSNIIKASVV